ncbi:MAG: hypothetical protein SFW07_07810 [Gammaproteobacteria bacterium]|nr:hypothetical protein [Gammaproteobacteria bacterium]
MHLKDLLLSLKNKPFQAKGICAVHFLREGLTFATIDWDDQKKPVVKECDFIQTSFDPLEILRALSSLVKKYSLQGYLCNWVLQPKDYSLISIPDLPVAAEELSNALKFHIKDQIDFSVTDAVVDYFKVPYLSKAQNEELIYVVVARKNYLDLVAKLIVESGLTLNVIDIPEFAVRNVAELFAQKGEGVAIIESNSNGSRLTIMSDGFVYLVRKIDVELNKTQSGDEFHVFVTEIQRSCDYYENGLGQMPVSKFLLISPDLSLASKLRESLGVSVEPLNVNDKLPAPSGVEPEQLQQCLYAIGGALRGNEKGSQWKSNR